MVLIVMSSCYQTNLQILSESRINRDISYIQTISDTVELSKSQNIVYNVIKSHTSKQGITDQGIADITKMPLSSVNARRNELYKKGLVVDKGSISYIDDNGHTRHRTLWIKV